jgi:hypothetical protein
MAWAAEILSGLFFHASSMTSGPGVAKVVFLIGDISKYVIKIYHFNDCMYLDVWAL